jgi:hypothetical protein
VNEPGNHEDREGHEANVHLREFVLFVIFVSFVVEEGSFANKSDR